MREAGFIYIYICMYSLPLFCTYWDLGERIKKSPWFSLSGHELLSLQDNGNTYFRLFAS